MEKQNELEKFTISIPTDTKLRLDEVKEYFHIRSNSAAAAIGMELLHWVMQQYKAGYDIQARIETNDKIILHDLPIKKPFKKTMAANSLENTED